jgi:hypothetical protein
MSDEADPKKLKMIKLLQLSVVIMGLLFFIVGLVILFFFTDKMEAFKSLIATYFPMYLGQVIPALIGTPLTEWVRNKK